MTTSPMPAPPPPSRPLIVPAHRVAPSPTADRRLRRVTTWVGAVIVLVVVLGLAALTTATWLAGRGYSPTPAVTGLGRPPALTLTSTVGDVRVLTSPDVEELTLALVAPGAGSPPSGDPAVPATLTRTQDAEGTTVAVRQPSRTLGPPWGDGARDVLVLVPTDLELALEVSTDVGDVVVEAAVTSLVAHSEVGDLALGPLSVPGGVRASSAYGDIELALVGGDVAVDLTAETGDVALTLPEGAGGRVSIAAALGDVRVAAPGTARWTVRADSALGDVRIAAGVEAPAEDAAGTMTVEAELGTVSIAR